MCKQVLLTILACGAIAAPVRAQVLQQRARITGGGNNAAGKCTVEVVVDGAAEVEVRGGSGTLRNVSGQPPQWRRFECTGVMPNNPGGFRFRGVDGRGRVQLVRDPRQGGAAVVRIEDSGGGAEAYTFDLVWGGGGSGNDEANGYPGQGAPPRGVYKERDGSDERRNERDRSDERRNGRDRSDERRPGRWTTQQAVQGCQEAITRRVADRFRTNDVVFQDVRLDDNPGRNDSVIGGVDVRRNGREERYRFSCSVDFNNGSIRSAEIQRIDGYRERGPEGRSRER